MGNSEDGNSSGDDYEGVSIVQRNVSQCDVGPVIPDFPLLSYC